MQNNTFQLPDSQNLDSEMTQAEVDSRFKNIVENERPFGPDDLRWAAANIERSYAENSWIEHDNWDRDMLERASKDIVNTRRQASADPYNTADR